MLLGINFQFCSVKTKSLFCTEAHMTVFLCVSSNPTPGVIINRPNGSDVYKGVLKDYTGDVGQYVHL